MTHVRAAASGRRADIAPTDAGTMVQFAHPQAGPPLRPLARILIERACIRWFREPGAWVERSRHQPRIERSAPSTLPRNRLSGTLND